MTRILDEISLPLLHDWARHSERHWNKTYDSGFYGTGFNSWGVQTNQKYLSALAVLATHPASVANREWAIERATAALRFSLDSHLTGDGRCTDGTQWGNTWISALGIERMMFGVYPLLEHLSDEDSAALRRVLTSEANYLLNEYSRHGITEITGELWDRTGRNTPESNLWNGALLWRTAAMYPDHPHASDWQERAHCFFINGVSVPSDGDDNTIIAGKPVRQRFNGANFFPHFGLDHHGYFNVGYMAICVSNAAILHFDLKQQNLPRPETLDHHQRELWEVLRRMIFPNGRLARLGGDSRVRYSYCQEYLLPSLLYAADHLGENHAAELLETQVRLIAEEAKYSGDGSFYGKRLGNLQQSPYYFTRLESDRACCLAMLLAYAPLVEKLHAVETGFESSVVGTWVEPEYGAVLHRCPTRLASFSWHSYGMTQVLCLPPDFGHLAEWPQSLSSVVRFLGDDGVIKGGRTTQRKVIAHFTEVFDGGFVTCGEVSEGMALEIAEGCSQEDVARHYIAIAALPDAHTVVGLELIRATDKRSYLVEMKGLHFVFANDLYNGFTRRIATSEGELQLLAPAHREDVVPLNSRWANVDGRVGVRGIYGADNLSLHRVEHRRGGKYQSLYTEEICFPCRLDTQVIEPQEVILDIGWMVLSDVTAEQTACAEAELIETDSPHIRAVRVRGNDARLYTVVADFHALTVRVEPENQ